MRTPPLGVRFLRTLAPVPWRGLFALLGLGLEGGVGCVSVRGVAIARKRGGRVVHHVAAKTVIPRAIGVELAVPLAIVHVFA